MRLTISGVQVKADTKGTNTSKLYIFDYAFNFVSTQTGKKKCQNLGFELDPTASKHVATKVPVKKKNQLNASK